MIKKSYYQSKISTHKQPTDCTQVPVSELKNGRHLLGGAHLRKSLHEHHLPSFDKAPRFKMVEVNSISNWIT